MIIVDLYKFQQGATTWLYTSSKGVYTYNSEIYSPAAIDRGNLVSSSDVSKNQMNVAVDFQSELGQNLLVSVGNVSTTLTLFRSINGVVSTAFKGRLAAIQPDKNVLNLSFVSVFALMRRQGIRRPVSRSCPFALYGNECGLDPNDFSTSASVVSISGTTLVLSFAGTFANGYFDAGFVQFGSEKRMIRLHQGASFTLSRTFTSIAISDSVTIFPGCSHSHLICQEKFTNQERFGGLPYIPLENPFSSTDAI